MSVRERWSRLLMTSGGAGMLAGAFDPLEGSLVILAGAGLVALGSLLGDEERRVKTYRVGAFVLLALGIGALWGLSALGGFGGSSGRSNWWALLVVPYFAGWSLGVWGPGSRRWMQWVGVVVGLWYVTIFAVMLVRSSGPGGLGPGVVIAAIGVATIVGCASRLIKPRRRRTGSEPRAVSP